MSRLFSLSAAIGILQLTTSHFWPVNAALPFTLQVEMANLTKEDAGSRFGNPKNYTFRNGVKLSLGTPRQTLYLLPVTSETELFVADLSQCEPWYCEDFTGGQFASNESYTWKPTVYYNISQNRNESRYVGQGNATIGSDVGELPGASIGLSLKEIQQNISLLTSPINTISRYAVNVLGLGKGSTFLGNLRRWDVIPKNAFGYFNYTLDIGDINEDRIAGERFEFPIVKDYRGGFRVSITDMEIDGKSIMTRTPGPINGSLTVMRGVNYVPRFVYEDFMNMTGGREPDREDSVFFPGWNDTVSPFTNYKLVVTLSNGLKLTAPESHLRSKVYNSNGVYTNASITSFHPIDTLQDKDYIDGIQVHLSGTFLNTTYFYADYDRDVFELADAKLPPAAATTTTTTGNSTGNGTSPGDDPSSASSSGTNMYALAAMALISSAVMIGGAF